MNTIASAIMKRKSVRQYQDKSVSNDDMTVIKQAVESVKGLYPEISIDIKIVEDGKKLHGKGFVGGYGAVNAPHYIVVTSEKKDGYLENVGFALEQIVLKLTDMGIGSCWLGRLGNKEIAQIIKLKDGHEGIISLAFGYPQNPTDLELRLLEERNRKKINQVVFGGYTKDMEDIFEFVLAAPSGINAQKTEYYICGSTVHIYTGKHILKTMNNNYFIDAGIALSHLCLICAEKEYRIEVRKDDDPSDIKGKQYITSVKFIDD